MNSERFKAILQVFLTEMLAANGGIQRIRELHKQADQVMFLTGWMCGWMRSRMPEIRRNWVDERPIPQERNFTLEEVRRISDYIRLAVETESTTS